MNYIGLCKIEYRDTDANTNQTEYRAVVAKNFTGAMKEIEDYYGEDLVAVEITLIENYPLALTKDWYETMVKQSGREG